MKYRLYDVYDDRYKIGEYSNMNSVKASCRNWEKETDGECCFWLYELGKDGIYHIKHDWTY